MGEESRGVGGREGREGGRVVGGEDEKAMMTHICVAGYFWTSLQAEALFPGLAVLMHCARSLK